MKIHANQNQWCDIVIGKIITVLEYKREVAR